MIASRIWNPKTKLTFYVAELPGRGGIPDWGYVTDPKNALNLTPYWAKRFAAHCRRVGAKANFT